jgi:protein STE50
LTGNRIERCLSYDEKPLLLFQKLKDAKKNPVFMLKHIKDIRSPIAVAQQKQAARKASSETSSAKSPPSSGASLSSSGHGQHSAQTSHDRNHPPKLQVNSHVGSIAPGIMTGGPHAQNGWPEIMSPAVESKDRSDEFSTAGESSRTQSTLSGTTLTSHTDASESTVVSSTREIPPSTGVSYAVAIYPYMAEQEDEFDVVV